MKIFISLIIGLLLLACEPTELENIKQYDLTDVSIESVDVDWRIVKMYDKNTGFIGGIPQNRFEVLASIDHEILVSDTVIYNIEHTYSESGLIPQPCLYKTIDGGLSWQPIYTPFKNGVMQIDFIDERIGYVATYDEGVYKTINGGMTWKKQLSNRIYGRGIVASGIWSLSFKDENHGYAYMNVNHSLKTTDGGNNWVQNEMNKGNYVYNKENTAFVNSSTILYKTDDDSNSWIQINPDADFIFDVYFYSPQWFNIAAGNKILETKDGGSTWNSYPLPGWYSAEKLILFENKAFLLDPTGVYHFPDITHIPLSETKYEMTRKRNDRIFDIAFPDASTGFAVGDNGLILKYEKATGSK